MSADAITVSDIQALPPLPRQAGTIYRDDPRDPRYANLVPVYTAEQMKAYALAALTQFLAAKA